MVSSWPDEVNNIVHQDKHNMTYTIHGINTTSTNKYCIKHASAGMGNGVHVWNRNNT